DQTRGGLALELADDRRDRLAPHDRHPEHVDPRRPRGGSLELARGLPRGVDTAARERLEAGEDDPHRTESAPRAILPRVGVIDTDPVAELLRGVPFFAGLDRVDLARLLGALEEVHGKAGEVISAEGAEADALYLLQDGRLAISVSSPDGEIWLRDVKGPAHFGELGLLLARRTATSRALTDVVLWRLPRTRFEALVRDRPQIGLAV